MRLILDLMFWFVGGLAGVVTCLLFLSIARAAAVLFSESGLASGKGEEQAVLLFIVFS